MTDRTEQLIDRLNRHIKQMAPHHLEREAGQLLIEATIELERLQCARVSPVTHNPQEDAFYEKAEASILKP